MNQCIDTFLISCISINIIASANTYGRECRQNNCIFHECPYKTVASVFCGWPLGDVASLQICLQNNPELDTHSIILGNPTISLNGKPVAFHGCHTACGAALISAVSGKHGLG
ncbi:PAAR domain-containing protein [Cobetia sp. MMG027]|uniref:PAAR domain-containing protein n=1 Tax=Cobetia sp. MMG027 TaxID=3021980 RepID=UPI003FA435CC